MELLLLEAPPPMFRGVFLFLMEAQLVYNVLQDPEPLLFLGFPCAYIRV